MDKKDKQLDQSGYQAMYGRELRLRTRKDMERTVPGLGRAASTSTYPSSSSVTSSTREPTNSSFSREPASYFSNRSDQNIIQVMIFWTLTRANLG